MKYLIKYNSGYGEEFRVVDCNSQAEADATAREDWRDAVESQADYSAEPLTQELAEDYGIEDELEGED